MSAAFLKTQVDQIRVSTERGRRRQEISNESQGDRGRENEKERGEKRERKKEGKFGLRVIAAEVTTLHHEQFVDGIVDGRVQALRQRRGVVR